MDKANQKVVIATVIQTWGSSPRQAGSRMIINEKGDFSGSVSGGCVESAVVREGIGLIKDNKPFKKIEFNVSNESGMGSWTCLWWRNRSLLGTGNLKYMFKWHKKIINRWKKNFKYF